MMPFGEAVLKKNTHILGFFVGLEDATMQPSYRNVACETGMVVSR